MDRLQILVFSFYREDILIQQELIPLRNCQLSRSWGSIRIKCLDEDHMEQMTKLLKYLKRPFAELKLGQQIVLQVNGGLQRIYPISNPLHKDLLSM